MALIKVKPTSPGRRSLIKVVNPDLHKGEPYAPLVPQKRGSGRNNNGHITTRPRAAVTSITTASSTSVATRTASRPRWSVWNMIRTAAPSSPWFFTLMANVVMCWPRRPDCRRFDPERRRGSDQKVGNALPIRNIPVGTTIHAIELQPGKGPNCPIGWLLRCS